MEVHNSRLEIREQESALRMRSAFWAHHNPSIEVGVCLRHQDDTIDHERLFASAIRMSLAL